MGFWFKRIPATIGRAKAEKDAKPAETVKKSISNPDNIGTKNKHIPQGDSSPAIILLVAWHAVVHYK